jgi:hypothetical protein
MLYAGSTEKDPQEDRNDRDGSPGAEFYPGEVLVTPIYLPGGALAPEAGTFYPGEEARKLLQKLKNLRARIADLEIDLRLEQQRTRAGEIDLLAARGDLRVSRLETQEEALLCPSMLERNTGIYAGLGVTYDGDEANAGLTVLAGFKLGKWTKGRRSARERPREDASASP